MLSSIKTTVVNTSGGRLYFDFLPPYGRTLNANEEYTFVGSLVESMRRKGTNLPRDQLVKSMSHALESGLLSVKATPTPVFYDDTAGESVRLVVDDSTLSIQAAVEDNPGPATLIGPYVAPVEPGP
jgi:hypothetical protein